MDINEFAQQFPERMRKLEEFTTGKDLKDILGVEAVEHFKLSFENEGFNGESLKPWAEVERRKSDSPWYGHSGQTGKMSPARTTAKILSGETGELKAAIQFAHTETGVRVFNEKPYARVHNFGGMAKIYGKKAFQMIARPFIGPSKIMMQNIRFEINYRIKSIMNGN